MSIESLRTPDDRFANLPEFNFEPRYITELSGFEGLRLHYVDVGSGSAGTCLCLHGEPTWAYLYRKMIPVFAEAGLRVIAPDFFGFGRSDKPTEDAVYTFDFHRRSLVSFIEALDLEKITLVVQDWGGILGLTLPMQMPKRIERLVVMNTALPTGDEPPSDGFVAWRDFVRRSPDLNVRALMQRAVAGLSDPEALAYEAPFVDVRYKAGVRRFPDIVPVEKHQEGADVCREAAAWLASEWQGESFMAVGLQDPVLGLPVMEQLRKTIRGCPEPLKLEEAGHFAQESGDVIARKALEHFGLDSQGDV